MPSLSETLAAGVEHQKAGRLDRAERIYREILAADPRQPDALHLLGLIARQVGRHDAAVEQIGRAVAVAPHRADFHNSLAVALSGLGRLAEAVASYREALRLRPDYAEAHCNLGNALARQGKSDEAIGAFRRALSIRPDYANAHNLLGIALADGGRLEEAVVVYREALRLRPDYPEALYNLGNALGDLGEPAEAAAAYRRALSIRPDYTQALNNLGNLLRDEDQVDEAVAVYRRAIDAKPDLAEARFNLANAYKRQGRVEEAAGSYHKLRQLDPDEPLWQLQSDALWPTVVRSRDQLDACRQKLLATANTFAAKRLRIDPATKALFGSEPPFDLQFDHVNVRPLKEAYAGIFRDAFGPEERLPPRAAGPPRIGFVVTAGNERLFLKSLGGILRRITPGRFDLAVVCHRSACTMFHEALPGGAIRTLPVSQRLDEIAETVRAARFDLLYYREVGTDAINYFLPFFRLAPVQCTSWGIQVTSGIPAMDYYLSSRLVEPEDADDHYSEKLLLADTLLPYRHRVSLPSEPKRREAFGFAADDRLYVCAQHLGKLHPDFDPMLREILGRDDRALIVLTADRYGYDAEKLRRRLAATMPEVAGRVVFVPRQSQPDYLSLLAAADVLLDPPHFGGMNTTYDGLSLGKPIVTWPSPFHRGRYTYACYRKMEFTECTARDGEDYVRLAVHLGTDAGYRAAVEQELHRRSDLLFEDEEAVREHQRLFARLTEEARSDLSASRPGF
jgi:predicted O-linked N-acetylglucosamine transferase (SPINDLY family)